MVTADTARARKGRGAFFTPEAVCQYVVRWAVTKPGQRVLEPSAGEAAFLLAAAERLRLLTLDAQSPGVDVPGLLDGTLDGIELHEASAAVAASLMEAAGARARVRVGDFFAVDPEPVYDAVVGNPPYVRYQDFAGESRARSRAAALHAGVELTNLASSWAAFTVHAALFLKPTGRLGLVLPAELLSVNYAAEVRRFLMRRFERVRLVLFTERVFPGVLAEVVLLLAEGIGPTDHCELLQVRDLAELGDLDAGVASTWRPHDSEAKWTPALLPAPAAAAYADVLAGKSMTTLHTWGETTLGMVTGANRYFAMSSVRAMSLGLQSRELLPLSPPGSRHLRGLAFTPTARASLGRDGAATMLFRPAEQPSHAAAAYIARGEADGVHQAYKCRVRTPWWRVPLVPPADLLLTYMNADTPRLTTNTAHAHHLNSVHGVYLREDVQELGRDLLPLASLNTVTLLGAETVGRAYGGGMLKLEPREADVLPVPSPQQVQQLREPLRAIRYKVAARLRAGQLLDAVQLVDQVLLRHAFGLSTAQVRHLKQAHAMLSARRLARGASPRAATAGNAGLGSAAAPAAAGAVDDVPALAGMGPR